MIYYNIETINIIGGCKINREKFIVAVQNASKTFDTDKAVEIVKKSVAMVDNETLIAWDIQELSELIKELTLYLINENLRNSDTSHRDRDNLLQEIGDVVCANLFTIPIVFGFSLEEVYASINVALDKIKVHHIEWEKKLKQE